MSSLGYDEDNHTFDERVEDILDEEAPLNITEDEDEDEPDWDELEDDELDEENEDE